MEAACRQRIVTPAEMKEFRTSWSRVRALVVINPQMAPQSSSLSMLTKAIPELLKIQPTGIYREVIVSKSYYQTPFVREFGNLIAAPPETEIFRKVLLQRCLSRRPPVYFEDGGVAEGLCCVCGNKGCLGRCLRCGLLMHYSCVAPERPGGPQPCPRCKKELEITICDLELLRCVV